MDRLEADVHGQADVLKIDLLSPVGRAAARRYHVTLIPALLLFDGQGRVIIHQQGTLNTQEIRAKIEEQHGGNDAD